MTGCELKSLLLLPFVDDYAHVRLSYENFDWFTHRSVKKNLISTASSFRVNDYLTHVTTLMDMQEYGLSVDHFENLYFLGKIFGNLLYIHILAVFTYPFKTTCGLEHLYIMLHVCLLLPYSVYFCWKKEVIKVSSGYSNSYVVF